MKGHLNSLEPRHSEFISESHHTLITNHCENLNQVQVDDKL